MGKAAALRRRRSVPTLTLSRLKAGVKSQGEATKCLIDPFICLSGSKTPCKGTVRIRSSTTTTLHIVVELPRGTSKVHLVISTSPRFSLTDLPRWKPPVCPLAQTAQDLLMVSPQPPCHEVANLNLDVDRDQHHSSIEVRGSLKSAPWVCSTPCSARWDPWTQRSVYGL